MTSATLSVDRIEGRFFADAASELRTRLEMFLAAKWRRLEQITFGMFMGSLMVLLVLLYADVPVFGL